ncbi:MAG: site-specific DNA-methyltransferase, partial [Candidatus Lokiarchaeota archaeon]|nr:site-specific DNA-methyltransferase [Candidatus Lokiarchaeota archaeon]
IVYDDARKIRDYIDDDSVQVIITSPPYSDLRDYGKPGQIGLDQPYDKYLDDLDVVWRACHAVLKPSGSLWLNMGHQMIGGNMRYLGADCYHHLHEIGFKLKRVFYWYKRNYASGYHKRNLLQNFEPVYFFGKDPAKTKIFPDRAGFDDFTAWSGARLAHCSWNVIRKGGSLKAGRNNPHPAPFPDELVERILLLSSDENDVILDPFVGSGTTTKVARDMNRFGYGFELNDEFYHVNRCRMELNDDFTSLDGWIAKFDGNRKLGHETQRIKKA